MVLEIRHTRYTDTPDRNNTGIEYRYRKRWSCTHTDTHKDKKKKRNSSAPKNMSFFLVTTNDGSPGDQDIPQRKKRTKNAGEREKIK